MARPVKYGLRYFPLDTAVFGSRKIQRLLKEHGSLGFATYLVVLCEIYGKRGYYVPYTADFCFDVGFWLEQDEKTIERIIRFCVDIRLFDQGLLRRHGILSSQGIQKRFGEVFKRNIHGINPLYSLEEKTDVSATETPVLATETRVLGAETPVIATETPVFAAITPVSAAKTPTKIKTKIKEKENTVGNEHSIAVGERFVTPTECLPREEDCFPGIEQPLPSDVAIPPEETQTLAAGVEHLVVERFNRIFAGKLPKVLKLTKKRKFAVRTRLREFGMEGVEHMFAKAAGSDFLAGINAGGWRADFDWLFRTDNFLKVLEGNYENKQQHGKNTQTDPAGNRRKAEILRMAAEASAADRNS